VTGINNRIVPGFRFSRDARSGRIVLRFPALPLARGLYHLDLYFGGETNNLDTILDAIPFEMVPRTCSDLASCRRPLGSLYLRLCGNFSSKTRPRPQHHGISQP